MTNRITVGVDRQIYEKFKMITVLQQRNVIDLFNEFMLEYIKKNKHVIKKIKI